MNGVGIRAGKLWRQLVKRRPERIGQHDIDLGRVSESRRGEQRCQGGDGAHGGSCYSPNPLALKIDFAPGVVSASIIAFAASGCFELAVIAAE